MFQPSQAALLVWAQMGLKFIFVGVWAGSHWWVKFLEGLCMSWGRTPRSLHTGAWISVCGVSSELLGQFFQMEQLPKSLEAGRALGWQMACHIHVTQEQAGTAKFTWNWRMIRAGKWIIHLQSSGSNQTQHVICSLWRWLLGYKNSTEGKNMEEDWCLTGY